MGVAVGALQFRHAGATLGTQFDKIGLRVPLVLARMCEPLTALLGRSMCGMPSQHLTSLRHCKLGCTYLHASAETLRKQVKNRNQHEANTWQKSMELSLAPFHWAACRMGMLNRCLPGQVSVGR